MFKTNIIYRTDVTVKKDNTFKIKMQTWQSDLLEKLTQTPGKVKYPIRWTSERQRRAFFATKGFGRGIPTKRTGAVAEWTVFVDYDGIEQLQTFKEKIIAFLANLNPNKKSPSLGADPSGLLVNISNPKDYQRYVTGVDQQGFHKDTGWVYTPDIISDSIKELDQIVTGGVI